MIVPMKKLTLLCLQKDQQQTVEALERLGVVHVTHVRAPSGEAVDEARAQIVQADKVLSVLRAAEEESRPADEAKKHAQKKPAMPQARGEVIEDAEAVIAEVGQLMRRQKDLQDESETLRSRLKRLEPFGDFDPERIRSLANRGISILLVQVPGSTDPVAPEGISLTEVKKDREAGYFVLCGTGSFSLEEIDLQVPAVEVKPPEQSPAEMRSRIAGLDQELRTTGERVRALAVNIEAVGQKRAELREAYEFVQVRESMGEAENITYLQGYVPAPEEGRIRAAAAEHGWGAVMENPRPGEHVPTLLKYSRWIKPVQTVLNFLGIYPGYEEPDIGWTFLIFFSLFFAMLIGDAAYGIILGIATVVIRLKLKHKVPGYISAMLGIVSVTTFIWGVLSGTWLGLPNIPSFLKALSIPWLGERNNVIWLCFLIGATHLTIAHVWNALTASPKTKVLAEVGWLAIVWTMFFLAGNLVIGKPLPGFVLYMFGAGVLLVILFMATPQELKTDWINHALLPLTLIGNFVDVVSYVRLFAVGFASVAVIQSFNSMANSIGFDKPVTAVFAVLILIFAHSLNLVLGALGVLVHAVRLNTLEFSTHKGLQWQGFLYKPFGGR